ncbi:MAG: thiamine pyrophosphate-dependent dehydrogenase E1 component subunit alpha [Coprothermobacterota bacterium]|nr:thiamine pyrophosphate-dependent dehydrogenase E1 component subunit alpha [Coprothermobacterota bacterium]
MELDRDLLLGLYSTMVKIRTFEMEAAELFASSLIPGFVHLYAGEEAIATGVCAHLSASDYIASTHRGHGHLIAKGGNLNRMMAELFAKRTGYCKGKGGSMHIADVSIGILGANGIVGASLPIATGAGLACKLKGEGAISVCFFGDGASNRGTFHESLNLASAWELPVVYVCENNYYAISSCQRVAMAIQDIAERATGYGIPGVSVDGNDVLAVFEAAGEAVKRARTGNGASLLVANTWRHRGHFEGEPELYRDQEEHKLWLAKDPIPRFEAQLIERGIATTEDLRAIDRNWQDEVRQAVLFAEESPDPAPDELYQDVYAE